MENNHRFPLILSSFWLKVIAILTMTIDHIGFLFYNLPCAEAFRCIGRLALPLFCFMIAEGAIHTKSFKKYALRLGIMASIISLAMIILETPLFDMSMRDQGIIFIDLLLGALAIYLLRQKQWYFKLLAILPLAYGVASEIAMSLECAQCGSYILWFPYFMRTQYGCYGILMIIGFYGAYLLKDLFLKYLSANSGVSVDAYHGTRLERNLINITDLTVEEIDKLIATADDIVANHADYEDICNHKKLATLFFEPSTRTRLSFEAAMLELGGSVLGFSSANSSTSS